METVQTAVERVTPALAREWLTSTKINRTPKRASMESFAEDMRQGNWQFTGEAIKFDWDGHLIDGQHRLQALIAADVELEMLVVRGLPPGAQSVMDTGNKRSAADSLGFDGEKYAAAIAALVRMILSGADERIVVTSTSRIRAYLDQDPRCRTICSEIIPSLELGNLTKTVAAYAYWRLDKIDPEKTAEFFARLSSLADLPEGNPILALHKRLGQTVGERRSRIWRREMLYVIFSGWNAWVRGETRKELRVVLNSERKLVLPEPVRPRPGARNDGLDVE